MAVNLLAPMRLTRALLPALIERPEAHIVNVASMYGFVATAECAAYHASKFGLLGFSESLAVEFQGTNLGVTTVCPGFVSTNLFDHGIGSAAVSGVPHPPAWLCTTAQHVARRIIRAIRRRQRLVIITPLAWTLYYTNRYAPWLLPLARLLHRG
jgi:short-subunit dehydrogenase